MLDTVDIVKGYVMMQLEWKKERKSIKPPTLCNSGSDSTIVVITHFFVLLVFRCASGPSFKKNIRPPPVT